MNLETAEPAVAELPSDLALPALRVDAARMAAVRDVWRALWTSRLLVWAVGVGAVLAFGLGSARNAFHPAGLTQGFGRVGDVLAAPAARWDAAWYLVIAHYGYRPDLGAFTASRTAFFPLYPLGVSGLNRLGLPIVLAGVTLSLLAFALALYGLHRLMTLECERSGGWLADRVGRWTAQAASGEEIAGGHVLAGGEAPRRAARLAVWLTAFAPMAFYFSAVYSESLYLALSVGMFLCARRGRWGMAAALAALAGGARSTGVALAVPLALLYLYGPREDRPPDRTGGRLGLRPRYRLRREAWWVALVPVGLLAYMAHLALAGGQAFSPFQAQAEWHRGFAGPYGGVWDGAKAAFEGLRQLLSMQRAHVYFPAAGGSPFIDAGHNVMLFGFMALALPVLWGVVRRMPIAYGAYVLAALALPLSYPVASQPLMSLPRFLVVLFPLNMWLAARLLPGPTRARLRRPPAAALVMGLSAAALVFFSAEFATWHWVA